MAEDSEKLLAQGLSELLTPIVLECDERVRAVFASQTDLARQIDLLSAGPSLLPSLASTST